MKAVWSYTDILLKPNFEKNVTKNRYQKPNKKYKNKIRRKGQNTSSRDQLKNNDRKGEVWMDG